MRAAIRTPVGRALAGIGAGVVASIAIVCAIAALTPGPVRSHLVPEDASGALSRIAIHYVPAQDAQALPVWLQLFRELPAHVRVQVAVEKREDFSLLIEHLRAAGVTHLDRFAPSVADHALTTWSRDRMASLSGPDGVLSPPRVGTASARRAGDWAAPFAISHSVYGVAPAIAPFIFEGGDLAASRSYVFADANLIGRNLGHGDATASHLQSLLAHTFGQRIVFLGTELGDIPEHHIMMYMVPLDDHRVLVGDPRLGNALSPETTADADLAGHIARFDNVARELAERGFLVSRIPVVVLPGAGSYVTYTNAVFDRDADGAIVYLPTYGIPALDNAAEDTYASLGFRVIPIDVTSIYRMNGSLGCLVNVMARESVAQ